MSANKSFIPTAPAVFFNSSSLDNNKILINKMSESKSNIPTAPAVFLNLNKNNSSINNMSENKSNVFTSQGVLREINIMDAHFMTEISLYLNKGKIKGLGKLICEKHEGKDNLCECVSKFRGTRVGDMFRPYVNNELYYDDGTVMIFNVKLKNHWWEVNKFHLILVYSNSLDSVIKCFSSDNMIINLCHYFSLINIQKSSTFDEPSQQITNTMNKYDNNESIAPACAETTAVVVLPQSSRKLSTDDVSKPKVGQIMTKNQDVGQSKSVDQIFLECLDKLEYPQIISSLESKVLFYSKQLDNITHMQCSDKERIKRYKWVNNKIEVLQKYLKNRRELYEINQVKEIKLLPIAKITGKTKWKPLAVDITFTQPKDETRVFNTDVKVTKIGDRKIESKILANAAMNERVKKTREGKRNKGTGDRNKPQPSNKLAYTRNELLVSDKDYWLLKAVEKKKAFKSKAFTADDVKNRTWLKKFREECPEEKLSPVIEWNSDDAWQENLDDEPWDDYHQNSLIPDIKYHYNLQPVVLPDCFDFYTNTVQEKIMEKREIRNIEIEAMKGQFNDAVDRIVSHVLEEPTKEIVQEELHERQAQMYSIERSVLHTTEESEKCIQPQVFSSLKAAGSVKDLCEEISSRNLVSKVDELSEAVKDTVTEIQGHMPLISDTLVRVKDLTEKADANIDIVVNETSKVSNNVQDVVSEIKRMFTKAQGYWKDMVIPLDLIALEVATFFFKYDNMATCIFSLSKACFNIMNHIAVALTTKPLSYFSVTSAPKVTQAGFTELLDWIPNHLMPSVKNLQCFNTIVSAFKNATYTLKLVKQAFMDLLAWLLPNIVSGSRFYETAEYKDTMNYVNSLKNASMFKDVETLETRLPDLKKHCDRLEQWANDASISLIPSQFTICVRDAIKTVDAIARATAAGATYATSRPRPVGVLLKGPTSIGKSTLVNVLGKVMAVAAKKEYTYYPRTTGTSHWDGYLGQFMVLYDDFGQSTDFEEVPELFEVISTNPYLPPMATLDNPAIGIKGTFMTSEVIMATTNLQNFDSMSRTIHSPEALLSRFPIDIEILWRQGYTAMRADYAHAVFNITIAENGERAIHNGKTLREAVAIIIDYYKRTREAASKMYDKGGDLDSLVDDLIETLAISQAGDLELGATYSKKDDNAKMTKSIKEYYVDTNAYYSERDLRWKTLCLKFNQVVGYIKSTLNVAYRKLTSFLSSTKWCLANVIPFATRNFSKIVSVLALIVMIVKTRDIRSQTEEYKKARVTFETCNNADEFMNAVGNSVDELCPHCFYKMLHMLNTHGYAVKNMDPFNVVKIKESYVPRQIKKSQMEEESYVPRQIKKPQNAETTKYLDNLPDSEYADNMKKIFAHPVPKMGALVTQGFVDHTSDAVMKKLENGLVLFMRKGCYVQAIPIGGLYYLTVSHFFRKNQDDWNTEEFVMYDGVTKFHINIQPDDIGLVADDAVVIRMPEIHQPKPDITKYFCRKDEIEFVLKRRPDSNYKLMVLPDPSARNVRYHHFQGFDYRPEVTYSDPDKNQYVLRDSLSYNVNSHSGWCGAPIVIENNNIQGKIMGIHTWGIPGIARGGCTLVSREQLDAHLQKRVVPHFFCLQPPKNQYADSIYGILDTGKHVPNSRGTKLRKSAFFDKVHTLKTPTNLSSITLIENNIKKFSRDIYTVDKNILKRVEDHIVNILDKNTPKHLDIRHTYEEAISSYENLAGMNLSTSAGYPWVEMHKEKRKMIDNTEGNYIIKDKQLRDVLSYREECYKSNIVPFTVWTSCCKDELLKPGKATRLFEIGPVEQVIHGRKLFGTFMDFFHGSHCKFFSAVGMNPESHEWNEMVTSLLRGGNHGLFSDWEKFDCTELSMFMFTSCNIINRWYDRHVKDGLSKDRYLFFLEGMYRYTMVGSFLLYIITGLASGWLLTTIVNTINNAIIHFYIYLRLAPTHYRSLRYLEQNSYFLLYGDDAVISVSDTVAQFYNSVTIAQEALKFGMMMQSDKKGEKIVISQSIFNLTFLKRSISDLRIQGNFVPILNLESMMCMIAYYTESKVISVKESHQAIIDSFLQFAYFYGETFFNYFKILFERERYICHDFDYYDGIFRDIGSFDLLLL